MARGSRARRYPPPFPFRLCRTPWFRSSSRISSRNFGGICCSRARSAIRTGVSGPGSAKAIRALRAYLVFRDIMVAHKEKKGAAPATPTGPPHSHVTLPPQRFQPAAAGLVLGSARTLRDVGELARAQLHDDVIHVPRVRLDRVGAGIAAQRPVPHPVPLVVVERDR